MIHCTQGLHAYERKSMNPELACAPPASTCVPLLRSTVAGTAWGRTEGADGHADALQRRALHLGRHKGVHGVVQRSRVDPVAPARLHTAGAPRPLRRVRLRYPARTGCALASRQCSQTNELM